MLWWIYQQFLCVTSPLSQAVLCPLRHSLNRSFRQSGLWWKAISRVNLTSLSLLQAVNRDFDQTFAASPGSPSLLQALLTSPSILQAVRQSFIPSIRKSRRYLHFHNHLVLSQSSAFIDQFFSFRQSFAFLRHCKQSFNSLTSPSLRQPVLYSFKQSRARWRCKSLVEFD